MNNDDLTINYKCYLKDKADKQNRNLDKYIIQNTNFYNGKQYEDSNVTNMVRTSLNICQMMVNTKASNIVGTPRFFTFTNDTGDFDCTRLEQFDEYNRKKMNEDVEDYITVKNGFIAGTAIDFFRWDEDDTAYPGIFKGGLVREHIDPLNFAVADSNINNIQKQKWVMFWRNEEIGAVKELVEGKNDKEIEEKCKLIVPDDYTSNYEKYKSNPEAMTYELVTVFTRYFRINGEVFFMCSTKNVDLFDRPHSLNPNLNIAIAKTIQENYEKAKEDSDKDFVDYEMDFSDVVMQTTDRKRLSKEEYSKIKNKFSLYPFSVFTPLPLNNSFYGNSDVREIIPIQKGINFAISMNLKCVENAAYNKIFVKDGALAGQQITNEPGQVIVDHSRGVNGWGIKLAEPQPIPNQLLDQTRILIDLTRHVYGFSDVIDGSVTNKDVSGYALQLMMKQSKTTLEQIQKIFWNTCKANAEIRLMFYKHFVNHAKFLVQTTDLQTEKDNQAREILLAKMQNGQLANNMPIQQEDLEKPVKNTRVIDFSGSEIQDMNFDIDLNIDVMQGTVDSKLAEGQIWDTLIVNGGIQNLDPQMLELFMEANPIITPRSKAVLKEVVERQKQSELAQTKAALQQATLQIEQLMKYSTDLKGKLDYLDTYNKKLTDEFTNKINIARQINGSQQGLINKLQAKGKSQGEVKSNNSMGIDGGVIDPNAVI